MTDLELIQLVREGKTHEFAELVRRHHANIIGVCRGILIDPIPAEDAAQDTFIKAFEALSSFKGKSSFSTWLYRIATNLCLDLRRKGTRQKMESLDEINPSIPVETEHSSENRDLANKLLAELSDQDRAILVLRESQGLSYDEIVEALDISLDAVKSRLKRARQHIQEKARHFLRPENV